MESLSLEAHVLTEVMSQSHQPIVSETDAGGVTEQCDNTVRLWDLQSGDLLDEIPHPDCVAAVSFDPAGERLVVGCDDAHVYLYDVADRHQ
jgi:WD40 repeat protein